MRYDGEQMCWRIRKPEKECLPVHEAERLPLAVLLPQAQFLEDDPHAGSKRSVVDKCEFIEVNEKLGPGFEAVCMNG